MVVGRVLQIVAHRRSKCIVKPSVREKSVVKRRKSLMAGVVQYRYHCTFLSGCISRTLLKTIDCEEFKIALNFDPVSCSYLDEYNKGGHKLPTSSLNNYTLCAFSTLEYLEQRIIESEIPQKF